MAIKLPDDENPYSGQSPFEVLGVPRTASATEIRDAYEGRIEEIDDTYAGNDAVRLRRRAEVKAAYDALRDAKERAAVHLFFFDDTVGRAACREAGEKHKTLDYEFTRILQGAEDVLSTTPDVDDVTQQFREVVLQQSTRMKTEGSPFKSDLQADVRESIAFER
jgi:DnaJ-class molecular chaperone